jgi:superfamily II DNA/RNA helicase
MSFSSLKLSETLLAALPLNIKVPSEIQLQAIPAILAGRDLLALAQTGSGKTLAYSLPLLEGIDTHQPETQAIIIVPTRELASQVQQSLDPIAKQLRVTTALLIGGIDLQTQLDSLSDGVQIIIATPGRLNALLLSHHINTDKVKLAVLDEADRLQEMGFWPDVKRILSRLPDQHQSLLFSATLPDDMEPSLSSILRDPLRIEIHHRNQCADPIASQLYLVNKGSKAAALIHLIKQHQWPQVLVFINARDHADALVKKLSKQGIHAAALHGEKDQIERQKTLDDFKNHNSQVLVTTDVLARGIHIDHLPIVINFDLPENASMYIHRVGRTARYGENGHALSLVCHGEMSHLEAIRTLTQQDLPLQRLVDFPVTDQPSNGESKRPARDKKANRRNEKRPRAPTIRSGVSSSHSRPVK